MRINAQQRQLTPNRSPTSQPFSYLRLLRPGALIRNKVQHTAVLQLLCDFADICSKGLIQVTATSFIWVIYICGGPLKTEMLSQKIAYLVHLPPPPRKMVSGALPGSHLGFYQKYRPRMYGRMNRRMDRRTQVKLYSPAPLGWALDYSLFSSIRSQNT